MKIKLLHPGLVLFFLLAARPLLVVAGNIIYPWRAVSAIVKTGAQFDIGYNNINWAKIDSVCLAGPYNKVTLGIDSVSTGRFEYDSFTHLDMNNKIWVHVPVSAPEELYDLVVHSGGEIHVSPKSVKVLRQFNPSHTFIHISDPHITRQWQGTPENGYAKELELFDSFVKVANIIAPDFIIITGDLIHHYTRFDADSAGWGGDKVYGANQKPLVEEKYKSYFEGAKGFAGIHGLNSPTFSAAGNHDFYGVPREAHLSKATQWNNLCGKRVYGFSYGGTRIMVADDFLGDPASDIPDLSPMSGLQGKILDTFLQESGMGSIRIMAQHRPDRIDTMFVDRHKINILLNGHRHDPFHEYIGSTPTLSIRPGTICKSGEIKEWQKELGFFRIFRIHDSAFEFTPALRFCSNPTVPYQELELNLTLDFQMANDGFADNNEAIIRNLFPVNLPDCKIRFVMKKGDYKVTGGKIQQIIQSKQITVVDVRTDVHANDNKVVKIARNDR